MEIEDILKGFDEGPEQNIDWNGCFKAIKSSWKTILLWACISAVIGVLIGFSIPKTYTSKAIIAPELTTRTTSGLSSLANLAGINVSSMAVTDAMHTDLYPIIMNSTPFISGLFDMPVEIERHGETINTDLYDYLLNHNRAPWWDAVISLPGKGIDAVKNLFSKEPEEEPGYENMDQTILTKEQSGIIKAIQQNTEVVINKKTYSVSISVKMQDAKVAADLANEMAAQLEQFVQQYRTEKARHNLDYYISLQKEAQEQYYAAQKAYARYLDKNQGVVLKSALVEKERLQNEANLQYQVYNQLSQQVQTGKAKVEEESPVLVVIQPGVKSYYGSPSKKKLCILFFFLGAILAAGWKCLPVLKNN